jgi:ADP-ribose pyrophosphatase
MKQYGPWKITSTEEVYRDPFVNLKVDQVIRPDGLPGQHVVVGIKPGVCLLAMDEHQNVHLTKEFHYAIGRDSIEAVSGGIEPGEEPDATAHRELQEELGIAADHMAFLTTLDPFTSCMISPTRLYFATGLSEVASNPDGTERIETAVMPLTDAVQKVLDGEITHAPTCVLLLRAQLENN